MKKALLVALSVASLSLFATPAHAAFINIDDSNLANITITAGDFEGGFFVDGNLLTTGLGNSASITFADSGHSISGSWIDLGLSGGSSVVIEFALPVDPTFTTSGIEFSSTTNGSMGTLTGSFGGYISPAQYFFTTAPTLVQNGQTGFGSAPFLSVSFKSEAPIPEPATMLLFGSALPGAIAMIRRRRRA